MMFKALLLDLDDTLLNNSMDAMIPAYFQALTQHVQPLIPSDQLISALMEGMQAMEANDGRGLTNEEVFASVFFRELGHEPEKIKPLFMQFYAQEFPKLRTLTQPIPAARKLMTWAFEHELQVVIATNALFPRTAIEQRLEWAEVPVREFDYTLVTTYENMHALKPHPAYYREILRKIDRKAEDCLMAGDDWERDILPAASVGIPVFWIAEEEVPLAADDVNLWGRGSLFELWSRLKAGMAPQSSDRR
jgi:FMN phosphatase YigB (HAD superfamily)